MQRNKRPAVTLYSLINRNVLPPLCGNMRAIPFSPDEDTRRWLNSISITLP
ncbi:hypothetical protein FB99_19210 [Pantoea agglomerans]|nr:hypothetical protein FB99_19210 [Pantoea agglomerans]